MKHNQKGCLSFSAISLGEGLNKNTFEEEVVTGGESRNFISGQR